MNSRAFLHVEAFVVAAASTSFREAADKLGRKPSAITNSIQSLEAELLGGRPLFRRHAHGVELTADGQRLLPLAQEFIAVGRRIEESASDLLARPTLRIGTIQGAWFGLLRQVQEALGFAVEVKTTALDPYWPTQPLLQGKIDCALLPAPSDHDNQLDRYSVFTEQRFVSVSTESPFAARGSATIDEIDEGTWIGSPPGADRRFVDAHLCNDLRPGHSPPPRVGEHILSPIDMGESIRRGEVHIGTMPSISSMFAGLMDGVTDVEIEDAPPWRIDLVVPKRTSLVIDADSLASAIRKCAKNEAGLTPTS